MIDPERIQRLAAMMGNRSDSLELVRQMRCGGKKYPGGGKFFRTNLQNESPLMYQPMVDINYPIETPLRFRPQPDLGDYQAPASTGMVVDYPISLPEGVPVAVSRSISAPVMVEAPVENLFSDEMIARRALKQRYAESAFDDKAKSHAGAQGAWQIMPITLKDYLGRGRGKAGDLNDPEYNRKVRDWVMGIIPRDLKEFWSDSDSDRAKLAKLYAAYNWGAGNLRSFLRKKRDAGVDIGNPDNWVDDLNPETRRYVKYLAFDEDIPDSIYTNSAFEDAARKRGYMAEGGRLYGSGGPNSGWNIGATILKKAREKYLSDYADKGYVYSYPSNPFELFGYAISPYARTSEYGNYMLDVMPKNITDARRALFAKNFGVNSDGRGYENAIVESRYRPTVSSNPDAKYYTLPIDDPKARFEDLQSVIGTAKYDFGEDENGKYISVYDKWDLAPITDKGSDFLNATPPEIYDRFYQSEIPEIYSAYSMPGTDFAIPSSGMNFASGGKIHIKPENRGKFTALKKRTGHSASWFKAHGTPAQKKMAVFALNAKKWKHENGGYMNRYDGETEETGWLRRLLNTSTMVPNMTGTATAAATGLRDIPLTESTVGNELAVAGTAMLPLTNYLGTQAALGIDTMGRMAMPSTFLKGVSYYAPKAAGALAAASPWLDAGALSLWSAQAGNSAINAAKKGKNGEAVGYGLLAAMPFASVGYGATKNAANRFNNAFKLSPYDIDLSSIGADLDRSELLQRGEYAKNLLNRFYAISGRARNLRGWNPNRPQSWYNFPETMQSMRSGVYGQFADAARAQGVPLEEYLGNPDVASVIYQHVRPATSRLRHSLRGVRGLSNFERISRQNDNYYTMQTLGESVRNALNPRPGNEFGYIRGAEERFPTLSEFIQARSGQVDGFHVINPETGELSVNDTFLREPEVPIRNNARNADIYREVTPGEREEIASMFGERQTQAGNRGSDVDIDLPFLTPASLRAQVESGEIDTERLLSIARSEDSSLAEEARNLLARRGIEVGRGSVIPNETLSSLNVEPGVREGMFQYEYERALADYLAPYERTLQNAGDSEVYVRNRAQRELDNARRRFAARYYPLENGTYIPYTSDPDFPYEDLSVDTLNDMWEGTLFSDANDGLRTGEDGRLDMDAVRQRIKQAIRTVARRPFQQYFGDLSGLTDEQLLNGIERLRDRNIGYDYVNMNSGLLSTEEGAIPTQYNLRGRLASELFRRYNSDGRTLAMAPDNIINEIHAERFNSGLTNEEYEAISNERNLRQQAATSWVRTPGGYSAPSLTPEEQEARRIERANRHRIEVEKARNRGKMSSYISELRKNAKIQTGGATAGANAYQADFEGNFSQEGKELGEALNEYFAGKISGGEHYIGQVPDFSKIESVEDAGKVAKFLRENNIISPDTDLPWDITSLYWVSGDTSGAGNTAHHMLNSVPSGFSLRIGSLSGDSVPLALKGALTNYGTGPGQFTVTPAGREHSLNGMQMSALEGINPDGTAIFTQPGMIRRFGNFNPDTQLFTPEEAAEILGYINSGDFNAIRPEYVTRYQAAVDAVDRASAERINAVIRQINERNAELGLPQLDMARSSRTRTVGFDERYKSRGELWRPGFRNMKHKYGGIMNRMNSVYKNDNDRIRQAIANARSRQKK